MNATVIDATEPSQSQRFMAVSASTLTMRSYTEALYAHYGRAANLQFAPCSDFLASLDECDAAQSDKHLRRSTCASMEKAARMLNFKP